MTGCMILSVVMMPTHARRQQNLAFSSNSFLKLIPKHIAVPLTVHTHNIITI